jgi:quinol-cytochrome oxidoreductase complex cytochrome b subunit
MFSALLSILALPYTDLSRSRGIQFRPLSKIAFYVFVANFLILMQLGAKHVESPFIEFGQISTVLYFAYFFVIVPFLSLLENSLIELPYEEEEMLTNKKVSFSNIGYLVYPIIALLTLNFISINKCDSPEP